MQLFLTLFLICWSQIGVNSYKILGVFSAPAHSHYTLGFRLMKELADRGHEVTFINSHPRKEKINNFRDISVEEVKEELSGFIEMDVLLNTGETYLDQLDLFLQFGATLTRTVLKHKNVQQLLKSDEKFDLVILEHFQNEAMVIFAHKFKCPFIFLSPVPLMFYNNHIFANPAPASYVPNIIANYDDNMNFWERLENLYKEILGELYVHYKVLPQQEQILKEAVPDAPELKSMLYNASLMLTISHVSLGVPVPYQQNIKDIGGYHILLPKPLPKELQDFMDSSTEGVVVVSMGSNLKSANFDAEKRKAMLNAFSNIKQKVLWKFEADLPEKPDNVKILNWLPQSDVLAHPNTVAFISHGGLLGTLEAVHYGVPILGIPVFWDQMRNMEIASRKGYGLKIPYLKLNDETFKFALNEILNNPKYRQTAKKRSAIMRDQPLQQLDEAVFWIEYVIRHQGAPHLRSAAMKLKWYQLYSLDIFLFISTIIVIVFISVKIVLRNLLCRKKIRAEKKNQ